MYAIYGNMDPINIPQMLAYIPYMDPMGWGLNRMRDTQGFKGHMNGHLGPQAPIIVAESRLQFVAVGVWV